MNWQLTTVLVIVAIASGYLSWCSWRAWKKAAKGCSGSCGCTHSSKVEQSREGTTVLISSDSLKLRSKQ